MGGNGSNGNGGNGNGSHHEEIKPLKGFERFGGLSKKPEEIKRRARKMAQLMAKGVPQYKAAQLVGYAKNTAEKCTTIVGRHGVAHALSPNKRMQMALERVGIDDELVAKTLRQGMRATKATAGKTGEVTRTADHAIRHKFLQTALEIKDAFPAQKLDVSTGSSRADELSDEALEQIILGETTYTVEQEQPGESTDDDGDA